METRYSRNNVFSLRADVAGGRVSCNCDEVGSAGIGQRSCVSSIPESLS